MKVVILACGRSFQWEQIAIAFARSGIDTTLVSWRDDIIQALLENGSRYDVVVTTRYVLAEIHNRAMRNEPSTFLNQEALFITVQYDDIVSELFVVTKAQLSFRNIGLKYRCLLWTYCKSSFDFVKKHSIDVDICYARHPIYQNMMLRHSSFKEDGSHFYEDILGNISSLDQIDNAVFENRGFFSGKIIFMGNIPIEIPPPAKFMIDSLSEVDAAIDRYIHENGERSVLSFINHLLDNNVCSMNTDMLAKTMYFTWRFAQRLAITERVAIARELKSAFGDEFVVFGSGWDKFGIQSIPPNQDEALLAYKTAFACVDMGSIYMESCLYQRSVEILCMNGRIFQKRMRETDDIYGIYSPLVSFNNPADIVRTIGILKERPFDAENIKEEFYQSLFDRLDSDAALQPIMAEIK